MSRVWRPPPSPLVPGGLTLPDLSRRGLLRGAAAGGAGLALPSLLAACGTAGAKVDQATCTTKDLSAKEKTLVFGNWIGYIDPVKKPDSSLSTFEKQSGIQVDYRNGDVNDNESFFAKVSPQLQDCKSTGRDLFVVTDWMAARMIDLGWIQELDHKNLPNVDANLIDFLKSPQWDPKRSYSVPWQSGMTGICYNAELTDPVTSFKDLLTRKDLKGKIELLTEMRDTMLFMLLLQDSDPEDFSEKDFSAAISALQKVVDSGQVRRFSGNDYVDDMKSGDIVACEAWSGDVINLLGGGKFKFVRPEEGFAIWTDNMLVPNGAQHKANAEALMNFYYDPVNAAKLAAWNYYFCPVKGAQQEIGQFDKSAAKSDFIFVDQAALKDGYSFMALSEDESTSYQKQFNEVMAG
jgi:spermidine/putrescine transport system substrate-binding protein